MAKSKFVVELAQDIGKCAKELKETVKCDLINKKDATLWLSTIEDNCVHLRKQLGLKK